MCWGCRRHRTSWCCVDEERSRGGLESEERVRGNHERLWVGSHQKWMWVRRQWHCPRSGARSCHWPALGVLITEFHSSTRFSCSLPPTFWTTTTTTLPRPHGHASAIPHAVGAVQSSSFDHRPHSGCVSQSYYAVQIPHVARQRNRLVYQTGRPSSLKSQR